MAGKIIIDIEQCKGCGLCIAVCPKKCIVISKHSNKSGYFPVETSNSDCTGCAMCAIICPEVVLEVSRDSDTITAESGKKKRPGLIREKNVS